MKNNNAWKLQRTIRKQGINRKISEENILHVAAKDFQMNENQLTNSQTRFGDIQSSAIQFLIYNF